MYNPEEEIIRNMKKLSTEKWFLSLKKATSYKSLNLKIETEEKTNNVKENTKGDIIYEKATESTKDSTESKLQKELICYGICYGSEPTKEKLSKLITYYIN